MGFVRKFLASKCFIFFCTVAPVHAWAIGANELEFCADATEALTIETYTSKLQEYLTEKTGAVPAWLTAKAANKVLGKSKNISAVSGAASELNEFCEIASEGDEVLRAAKLLTKLSKGAGPVGSFIAIEMKLGLNALIRGSEIISFENTLGQAARSQMFFNIRIYKPRWYWLDSNQDRSDVVSKVNAVQVFYLSGGQVPASVEGNIFTQDDCLLKTRACFAFNFEYPDDALAVYAIKVSFTNGQSVFVPPSSLQIVVGEAVKTLSIDELLTKGGATIFSPRGKL